jgi:hypothetical protein
MARNGSGTYTLPLANVVAGDTILASWANSTMTDIGTALTASLAKDGQTVPSANLPMGTYRHTGVGAATALTDYTQAKQVIDNTLKILGSVGGSVNAITATAPLSMSAYATGQQFSFTAAGTNTSTMTININSIGVKAITVRGTTAVGAGEITSGERVIIEYDGTRFQRIAPTPPPVSGNVYIPEAANASADVAGSIQLWNKNTGTGLLHVTDDVGTDKEVSLVGNNVFITESASALGDTAGVGQLWVDDAAPNTIMFTNDAGTDQLIYTATTLPTSQYQTVMGSVTATTSGTTKDFTSIPAGVKKIAMQFEGMSTNGTSDYLLQLGDAGGIETSGYVAVATNTFDGTTPSGTSGFTLSVDVAAATTSHGWVEIKLLDAGTFTWVLSGSLHQTGQALTSMAGSKALSAELTQVRLTSVSPDTFDAGKINIQYSF